MNLKKIFYFYFLVSILIVLLFSSFAHFQTEAKPIFSPLYGEINITNLWFLLPFVILNYFILVKTIRQKKINFVLVFILSFSLILLFNSLKKDLPFYQSLYDAGDYYSDGIEIKDLKRFISSFDQKTFYFRIHSRTHPPGPILFHFFLNSILSNQAIFNSLIMVFLTLLTIFIVFRIAEFFSLPHKNLLLLLLLSSPGFLVYTATCMDSIFALLISFSLLLILSLTKKTSLLKVILTSLVIFLAMFFTYATVMIPLFILILLILGQYKNKKFMFSLIKVFLLIGLIYLFLWLAFGFRPIASFKSARFYNTMLMPDIFMTLKRYLYSVSANFLEYIIFLGLPIFSLFLISFIKAIKKRKTSLRLSYYLSFLLPMILLNVFGIYKTGLWSGETGRIWLFLTPLIIGGLKINSREVMLIAAFLSFTQALLMQLSLNFYW